MPKDIGYGIRSIQYFQLDERSTIMVNGKQAIVEEFVLHRIGESASDSVFSDYSAVLEGPEEQEFLRKLFLKPFATMAHTSEFIPDELSKNVLHDLCTKVEEGEDLVLQSIAIAKHVIHAARNHSIKGGDLFVAKFNNVELGSAAYRAIGIYKFDDKEVFIESKVAGKSVGMKLKRGLGTVKPNNACLVLFTEGTYTLFTIDDHATADFWQKDLIGLRPKRDNVNSTSNLLELTQSFITQQLPQDFEIAKADQIDLLNRSVNYFKTNSEFDKGAFAQEVFQEERAIQSFNQFSDRYQSAHDVEIDDSFAISPDAVKKQARIFKSVLKLDKNFHIYIHGDRNKIEHGVDESGRKFYKIYYDQES
ncbi:MAG: nucleoid-associated protein [Flavobacteriales bacterium]|nr:nucleoid-associated protein [Flavobacteriales bacterium]